MKTNVVLIGGPPGAGKTTLGRALAERLDWISLTVDDLLTAAQAVTARDTHPGLWVMKTGDPYGYFTNTAPEQLCADAQQQHDAIWPAIESVVRRRAKMNAPVVIDGWSLQPARVAELDIESVQAFWITVDHDVLRAREEKIDDFYGKSTDRDRMLESFLARSYWWNDTVAALTESLGLHRLHQDGSRSVEDLTRHALEAMRL